MKGRNRPTQTDNALYTQTRGTRTAPRLHRTSLQVGDVIQKLPNTHCSLSLALTGHQLTPAHNVSVASSSAASALRISSILGCSFSFFSWFVPTDVTGVIVCTVVFAFFSGGTPPLGASSAFSPARSISVV